MRHLHPEIILFSVQTGLNKDADRLNHQATITLLAERGIKYREFIGCYNGVTEQSLLVDAAHEGVVKQLCNYYSQESYLKSYCDRTSDLIYSDGRREYIGVLTKGYCATGSYTQDPATGQIWKCKL